MNRLEDQPEYKQAMINLITSNANYIRDEIINGKESKEVKDSMMDVLRADTKIRLLNILLK